MDYEKFSKLNYRKLKKIFVQELIDYYGENEANSVFYFWIFERKQWNLKDWVLHLDGEISPSEILWVDYQKLLQKMPVQYVVGKAYFMDWEFWVDSSVLIPRPETALLVHYIKNEFTNSKLASKKILDVCSGSGCISIALKKLFPNYELIGLEISIDAIQIAQKNANYHQTPIKWIQKNIFDCKYHEFIDLDAIVSNPPYVPLNEVDCIKEHLKNFEPFIALFSGNNPLIFYEKITDLSKYWLKNGGLLVYEVHAKYAIQVKQILAKHHFSNIEIIQDDFSKERMVVGRKLNLEL